MFGIDCGNGMPPTYSEASFTTEYMSPTWGKPYVLVVFLGGCMSWEQKKRGGGIKKWKCWVNSLFPKL